MLKSIERKLFNSEKFGKVRELLTSQLAVSIAGLSGSSISFLAKNLHLNKNPNVVIVTPVTRRAEQIWTDLSGLMNEKKVSYFPSSLEETGYTNRLKSESVGQQLKTLEGLIEKQKGVLVTSIQALDEEIPDLKIIQKKRIKLISGTEISIEDITNRLVEFDYERVDLVSGVGEFCVRGGLIDVYPYEFASPVRIEFFGDLVETIRSFDVISQRSENKIEQISILPPRLNETDNGQKEKNTLFELLSPYSVLLLDEPEVFERSLINIKNPQSMDYEDGLFDSHEEKVSKLWKKLKEKIYNFQVIEHRHLGKLKNVDVHFEMTTHEDFRGNVRLFRKKMDQFLEKSKSDSSDIFIILEEKYEVDRLYDLVQDERESEQIQIGQGILHSGFIFPSAGIMVITEKDLYGRVPQKRNLGKYRSGIPISKLNALSYGELMVHVDHGIGRYLGLFKISVAGAEQECLKLQYRDGDLLYVNIDHMKRVSRFKGSEGVLPQLNRLGGKDWDRLKEKTKKAIEKMAKDLLELYATRKAKKGFSFSFDQAWQKELEASFIYDETPDQLRTIEAVKKDMESESVMDRLVCGDVGFGKTEVALRAAFKSVLDGKQVAILVPTTVLAQQHFETFIERLKNYPVEIALLSRFKTKSQQKTVVEGLKNGTVDVVIGTHRLLSKDIQIKDLGLLIVDEEHRFGVGQKERIKKQFQLVDVLSLTATPIPRTLHLAMMGSRDMSTINSPPKDRLPVIVEVAPFDKNLVKQAILDEIHRGGQVFVVHNRVRSIHSMANMIQKLVPDLRVGVAHGQMQPQELERAMLGFVNKKYDCLVSTMIIESGLDMPNVNTLIVNRADKLGLAQLYQLKGRVGRSNRQAFAYLLAPAFKFLTNNALKRLQTIEEHLELGAGLQIAMKDLEIRGAGNLLGKQQSGFINVVGFDLYCKLLDEGVAKIKGEAPEEKETKPQIDVLVESEFDAYIPEDFVEMDYERVFIYQRLTNADSEEELNELEEELRDRFGVLPKPASVLIDITRLKILSARLGIDKLRIRKGELTAYFSDTYYDRTNPELLQKLVRSIQESSPELLRFLQGKKFGFKFRLQQKDETSLHFTRKFFNRLIRKAA